MSHDFSMDDQTQTPVELNSTQIGMRESTLLVLGASYAALMFDMQEAAVIGGWIAVGLIVVAMVRGPRPSGLLQFVYGLGIVLMMFWWPREHWWQAAITLLWIGIALMVVGAVRAIVGRRSVGSSDSREG